MMHRQWPRKLAQRMSSQWGGVAIVALLMLALGTLMIPPTLDYIGTGSKAVIINEDVTKRTYAADAGVEYALRHLASTETPPEQGETLNLKTTEAPLDANGSAVTVTILGLEDNTYRITATATDAEGRSTSTVAQAHVAPLFSDVLEYGVYALGDGDDDTCDIDLGHTDFEPSTEEIADGKMFALGDICLGNAEIWGSVYATDDIETNGHPVVHGTAQENASTGNIPDLGIDDAVSAITGSTPRDLLTSEIVSGAVINDPVKWTGDLTLGIDEITFNGGLWVTGDLQASSHTTLNIGDDVYIGGSVHYTGNSTLDIQGGAKFIVESGIRINGGADFDPEDLTEHPGPSPDELPMIISRSGSLIKINGGSNVAALLIAPQGNIDLTGGAALYGVAVAKKVSGNGGTWITYPVGASGMASFPAVDGGQTTIEYWKVNQQ